MNNEETILNIIEEKGTDYILDIINDDHDEDLEHYFLNHKLGIILPMYVYQLNRKGIDTSNLQYVMRELGDDLMKRAKL